MSMDFWVAALVIWLALLCTVVGVRMGWDDSRRARDIAFVPTEALAADQLFGLLLGANLAVLEHDDFNQLASKLPRRRIRKVLARYWNVQSARGFRRVVDERLRELGAMSWEEAAAIEAWQRGEPADSDAYRSLHDVLFFLSMHARIVRSDEMRDQHFRMLAWDVQQLACLLRLGFTLGYVSREAVWQTLDQLQRMARASYTSWKDYSFSALVGMGLRGVIDLDDIGDWYRIARSHTVLMAARRSLLARAGDWGASITPADVEPVGGLLAFGAPITAFDTLV